MLRKFHVSVHLRTPVDREGIVSKKICGNFDFMPLLKSYDNLKKFASYLTSKNTSFEHKIYAKYLLFVISKWYGKSFTIIGRFSEE